MSNFARSLSQRLTRRRRRQQQQQAIEDGPPPTLAPPPPAQDARQLASSTTVVSPNKRGLLTRGMDRIRRSLRIPTRRRDGGASGELVRAEAATSTGGGGGTGGAGGPDAWHPDESAVRAGLCTFQVKYLGSVEVFESRGMQVCEGALKMLRGQNKNPTKGVLHVSGDGLRLVDQQNHRGLVVDQTIEKVSFCAPDRNHAKGFAYICREGSSRRWMCHGFQAINESGERLSHAVGCAFAVCLERKKKRDEENVVTADKALNPNWDAASTAGTGDGAFSRANPAYSTFKRQMPLYERVLDPQGAIVPVSPSTSSTVTGDASRLPPTSIAKPRPSSNPALFERQGSLRAPAVDTTTQQFRRQFSLRTYDTPKIRSMGRRELIPSKGLEKSVEAAKKIPGKGVDAARRMTGRVARIQENFRLRQYGRLKADEERKADGERRMEEARREEERRGNGEVKREMEEADRWWEKAWNRPYTTPLSLAQETISEADESGGAGGLLLPELAGLMPATSPAAPTQPQAAPTYPTAGATPTVAWGPPAPAAAAPSASATPRPNAFAGSLSGFTPQTEQSVTAMWSAHSSPQSSARSRADEWLETALQGSLSLASPPASASPSAMMSPSYAIQAEAGPGTPSSGPPPSHPPPPLPPAALLASPDASVGERLFERQTENINPSWSTSNGTSSSVPSPKPSPFPTTFSPDSSAPPSAFPSAPVAVAAGGQPPCADPFDVQWSRLALSNSSNGMA